MRIFATVNLKGGVAKTTTTATLAWGLAKRGKKVLAIDLDPQGNLSTCMGAKIEEDNTTKTAYHWLCKDEKLENVMQNIEPNLDLIPADIDFSQFEAEWQGRLNRERALDKAIHKISGYDYVLVDSPPSTGLITINIMTAVDEVIVALKPEWLSFRGAKLLYQTIFDVKNELNRKLKINGFLLTMVDARRNIDDAVELVEAMARQSGSRIYKSRIRIGSPLADVPSYGISIFDYKPSSNVAKDYTSFVEEFLKIEGEKQNGN